MSKLKNCYEKFNRRDQLNGGDFASLMSMLVGVQLLARPAAEKPAEARKPGLKVKAAISDLGPPGRNNIDQPGRLPPNEPHAEVIALCDNGQPMVNRRASRQTALADKRAQESPFPFPTLYYAQVFVDKRVEVEGQVKDSRFSLSTMTNEALENNLPTIKLRSAAILQWLRRHRAGHQSQRWPAPKVGGLN